MERGDGRPGAAFAHLVWAGVDAWELYGSTQLAESKAGLTFPQLTMGI